MTTKSRINDFLAQKKFAVLGASRNHKKLGSLIYRELDARGYKTFPVNPNVQKLGADPCYPNLKSLPEPVDVAVTVVPPDQTEKIVHDLHAMGIKRVWMHQGSESERAVSFCRENGIEIITGECILMYLEPAAFFHRIHKFIKMIMGKLPE